MQYSKEHSEKVFTCPFCGKENACVTVARGFDNGVPFVKFICDFCKSRGMNCFKVSKVVEYTLELKPIQRQCDMCKYHGGSYAHGKCHHPKAGEISFEKNGKTEKEYHSTIEISSNKDLCGGELKWFELKEDFFGNVTTPPNEFGGF